VSASEVANLDRTLLHEFTHAAFALSGRKNPKSIWVEVPWHPYYEEYTYPLTELVARKAEELAYRD
jgi:hypothetical protein